MFFKPYDLSLHANNTGTAAQFYKIETPSREQCFCGKGINNKYSECVCVCVHVYVSVCMCVCVCMYVSLYVCACVVVP